MTGTLGDSRCSPVWALCDTSMQENHPLFKDGMLFRNYYYCGGLNRFLYPSPKRGVNTFDIFFSKRTGPTPPWIFVKIRLYLPFINLNSISPHFFFIFYEVYRGALTSNFSLCSRPSLNTQNAVIDTVKCCYIGTKRRALFFFFFLFEIEYEEWGDQQRGFVLLFASGLSSYYTTLYLDA